MYVAEQITWQDTRFIVVGEKECRKAFHCDGCSEEEPGTLTVLREEGTPNVTFWCMTCLDTARAG